jgi:hypothetical protein
MDTPIAPAYVTEGNSTLKSRKHAVGGVWEKQELTVAEIRVFL